MSNETTDHNKGNPTNNPISLVNAGNEETDNSVETTLGEKNHRNTTRKKKTIFKRVITFLSRSDKQPLVANIISLLMFVATAIIAYYTLNVFHQAEIQTAQSIRSAKASETSAGAAKKSADLQKQALDSQIAAKQQSDIADAKKLKRDTDFINKQKQGIDSQISAIKQTQKEFETSHSPYITVAGFEITPQKSLQVDILNQGTQLAIIISTKTTVKADKENKIKKMVNNPDDLNGWLPLSKIGGNAVSLIAPEKDVTFEVPINDTDLRDVNLHKKVFYIRSLIYYYNLTKEKYMTYQSVYKWNPTLGGMATIYFGYAILKKYP